MKKINLRDYYPFYLTDFYIEVSNDVEQMLNRLNHKDHADYERRRINKAYYSLDAWEGVEKELILLVLSPEEIYEQKLSNQKLYVAINCLPEKQAKRIYAYFFLGLSKTRIAQIERVNKSQISRSIEQALKNIEKYLKEYL